MSEPLLSTIIGWGPTWAPRGWALCHGQLIAISQETAVFSLIGTLYGGDGRTTFALPDLRGRAPIGSGSGPGLTPRLNGQRFGQEMHTLSVLEMPNHTHSTQVSLAGVVKCNAQEGDQASPQGHYDAASKTELRDGPSVDTPYSASSGGFMAPDNVQINGNVQVLPSGGNQSFNLMQPVETIGFIFAMQGIFPSRN
jgi:microcystin-dependent protein